MMAYKLPLGTRRTNQRSGPWGKPQVLEERLHVVAATAGSVASTTAMFGPRWSSSRHTANYLLADG